MEPHVPNFYQIQPLTHFSPVSVSHFYTHWKRQKTKGDTGLKWVNSHIQKYVIIDPEFVEKVQGKFYVDDLTLSWRRPLSYRNQANQWTGFYMDWFLYDNGLRHEKVKYRCIFSYQLKISYLEVQFNLRKWRTNSKKLRGFAELFNVNSEIVKNDTVNTGIVNSQTVNSEFVNKMKNRKVLGIERDDDQVNF